ncbi:MAG: hypothetical protein VX913_13490 [Planctomycetota bacterium]|nr:hypothetical protein [Planctomycetota bacterium]
MSEPAYCDCGKMFETTRAQAGGIVNCPGCGQAVDIPGLTDPAWRAMQFGALVAVFAVTALVTGYSDVPTGAACGLAVGVLMWLMSRAL